MLFLCTLSMLGFSQNIGINVNGSAPHQSALLDIDGSAITGSKRGLLIPRMTTSERDGIVSPAFSLLIFNTDDSCYQYFEGASWSGCLVRKKEYPSGMVDLGLFSIEMNLRPVATFEEAVLTCDSLGLTLPSLDQWLIAKNNLPFPYISNDWEWIVDAAQENQVTSIGGTGLGTTWAQPFWQSRFFRCVCEH